MKKIGLVGGTGPESTVMYYKELIEQLLLSCVPNLSLSKNMVIDNVNYADITTEATPEDYNNNTKC